MTQHGPHVQLKWVRQKGLKNSFLGRKHHISGLVERERERKKNSNFSLQSTEFHRSEFVGPRTKVHLLDEGYTWVPKFAEDSNEEFGKSQVSGLGSVYGTS